MDLTLNFLAMDYFFDSEFELKRTRLIFDSFSTPLWVLNFNFRELQKQFITRENRRNSQLA
ncbi:MAG: hypothetical protein MR902_07865 [Campylobacter sp.]|nr:hypothetical protein [Campylobacter sp.]